MSEKRDWYERNESRFEGMTKEEVEKIFEEDCARAEAAYEAKKEEERWIIDEQNL